MVFEQLYSPQYLREHSHVGFLLGVGYTILGLFIALMIFHEDPALIAVGITALFLIPSLYQLSTVEETIVRKEVNFLRFIKNCLPFIKVYVFVFFGMLFTFAFFAIMLPKMAANHLFREQLSIILGKAVTFSPQLFWELFTWNLQVLALCFIISLVAGNGAIIFLAWNASVWGTIFGNLAKTAALTAGASAAIFFLLIMLSVLPHTFLEGLSYIISAVSGTTISGGLVKERFMSKEMWKILKFNLLLLIIGIGVLFVACAVETYVLGNFTTYRTIIHIAFPR